MRDPGVHNFRGPRPGQHHLPQRRDGRLVAGRLQPGHLPRQPQRQGRVQTFPARPGSRLRLQDADPRHARPPRGQAASRGQPDSRQGNGHRAARGRSALCRRQRGVCDPQTVDRWRPATGFADHAAAGAPHGFADRAIPGTAGRGDDDRRASGVLRRQPARRDPAGGLRVHAPRHSRRRRWSGAQHPGG